MKMLLLLAALFMSISASTQKVRANRISSGTTTTNTQPSTNINNTTIQQPAPVFSKYEKMKLRLPFTSTAREVFVQKIGHFYVLNGDIIVGNDFPKTMSYSSDDHDDRWP